MKLTLETGERVKVMDTGRGIELVLKTSDIGPGDMNDPMAKYTSEVLLTQAEARLLAEELLRLAPP